MVLVAVQTSEFPLTVFTPEWFKARVKTEMALMASKIRKHFITVSTLERDASNLNVRPILNKIILANHKKRDEPVRIRRKHV